MAERLAASGHRAYLVGGSVRDLLLDRDPAAMDLDLTTDARPDDIERAVRGWADAVWTQGKRFETIGCRKGGRNIEITTHRAEAYRPDSRKPDVTFADEAGRGRTDVNHTNGHGPATVVAATPSRKRATAAAKAR